MQSRRVKQGLKVEIFSVFHRVLTQMSGSISATRADRKTAKKPSDAVLHAAFNEIISFEVRGG